MITINKFIVNIFNYIRHNFRSIVKFGIVGILTTIVYLFFIYIFYDILILDYKISISLAYIIGVFVHYMCNQKFTFQLKMIKKRVNLSLFRI